MKLTARRIGWGAVLCCTCVTAYGQSLAPLADRVQEPLFPSGITQRRVALSGKLAYLFQDEDGTESLHIIGDFSLTLGLPGGNNAHEFRSREAVVWISHRLYRGRPYRHLQLLLWRDGEIREVGGTITNGPVLYVTLNTFGEITLSVDAPALESSAHTQVYEEANRIRKAVVSRGLEPDRTPRRPKPAARDAEEDVSLWVFDVTGLTTVEQEAAPRPLIHFVSRGEIDGPFTIEGRRAVVGIGGVYLARGAAGSNDFLEIQADAAVVFLPPSAAPPHGEVAPETQLGAPRPQTPKTTPSTRDRAPDARQTIAGGANLSDAEAVYLEGDIVMTQGPNMVRASRLYFDIENDRAIILDAVVRTTLLERNIPLYLRAAQIRQLATGHYVAEDAILTTSEFHTPHYHIGASRVELVNRTPPAPGGRQKGLRAGSFRIRHATLNLSGHPIGYWPYIRGHVDTSETAIKRTRAGFSEQFGMELETEWHLFNVLGLETPEGFDATLSLEYYSRRGPAIGVDADYKRPRYYGLLRSYFLSDTDEDFLGREREVLSRRQVRGRLLTRHRQYLQDDWQLTFELSYISDKGFLEEFFESEFDNDKEQETLVHVKKQRDNWAFSGLLQWRILDFTTQTERLPDFSFHLLGEPLSLTRAETARRKGLASPTFFSENRVGVVRYRPADQTFRELLRNGRTLGSEITRRIDTRQELDFPLDSGPVRLVPFVTLRGSAWDDSPDDAGVARAFGSLGVRGSLYLSRIYPDTRSSLFDIEGVRHIIKPDVTAWVSASNRDPDELFPFDPTVEGIDDVDGVTLGLRQRWQTRRGGGENRRTVDFITLDTELGFFNNAGSSAITNGYTSFSRPENSIAHNHFNSSFIWRVNDRTALLNELNYDINDGEIDILNVSLAVERTPRLSYLLSYRFIEESDSNLLGFDMNYRLAEKHTLAVRQLFDLQRSRTLDFTVVLIRKFPRWFSALAFELDQAEDDFGVSLAVWPEGLPQAGVGSRRFTGLANTTRIRRD